MTVCEPELLQRYPLSAAQRRLWFIAQLNPDSCAYTNAHLVRFDGRLDADRLVGALQAVIARHDSLRMRFVSADGPGSDVVAVVAPAQPIVVSQLDAHDLAYASDAAFEERFVSDLAREPFDLETGPLIRAALLRVDAARHVFAIAVHHIISDRWSFGVLMRELALFYGTAPGTLPAAIAPLTTSYGQCSQAQAVQAETADADLVYWRAQLAGDRPTLELPHDRARPPVASDGGAVVTTTLGADFVRRVARVGAERKATPFMTFFAAFFVLLQRTTSQTDVLVGTPVAGRARLEREPLIGLFVNTLPVRVAVRPEQSFGDVLGDVRAATLGMLAHANVPFDRLVREEHAGREGSRNPFFDVLFNFHNTPAAAAWPSDLDVFTEDVDTGTSRIDLAVVLRPEVDGSLNVRFAFSTDLFERSTIETLAAHFRGVLESIVAAPDGPIGQLEIASEAERTMILDLWSRPDPVPPVVPPGGNAQTLDGLVASVAARHPHAIALVEDGASPLTYAELDRRANRLAHALRARGVDRDTCVGLYLERSVSAVVAMLATLKAGGAYVPLDPTYPPERIASMLASAGVTTIVTRRAFFAPLTPLATRLVDVDDPGLAAFEAEHPPAGDDDPDRLAYVIFTSGSTGTPKAVGIAQRGVVALLTRTPFLVYTPADRVLLHEALTFDASVLMWAPLIYGASIAVMPARPFSLAEFDAQLAKHAINVLVLSPALFNELVEERIACLRGLRRCTVGGDVLSPAHSARFVRMLPDCRLFNGYGPTEVTVAASFHEVLPAAIERQSVPIGRPAAEARIYILDDRQQPVPIGVAGELWIGGRGVARGYINDPELTAQRFTADRFAADPTARLYRSGDRARWLPDGTIAFLGRLDVQVKIRGFRIEPAEIEFALLQHTAVRHAAVVVQETTDLQRRLVAYVEVRGTGSDEAELRAFIQTKVPAHAIPARIVIVDAMPMTAGGKLDRRALPAVALGDGRALVRPPVSELQQHLIGMWERLLETRPIGIDDDFFALGGHSLLAARLIGEIEREFGTRLPLAVLFERPTIEHLADVLRRDPANLNRSPLVALNADGTASPLFFLHGSFGGGGYYCLGLAARLGADRPVFAMRPHGVDGGAIPPAIELIASECLTILKSVRPQGPYLLGGFCSGGLVAYEVARQLRARGDVVENVILIDVPSAGTVLRTTIEGIGRLARYARISPARRSLQRSRISRLARHVGSYTAQHGKRQLVLRAGEKMRAALDPAERSSRAQPALRNDGDVPDLAAAWRWISEGYVARTYAGRVTVLVSEEFGRRPNAHVHEWSVLAPRADVRSIPGEHLTCITDHIGTTAEAIAQALMAPERRMGSVARSPDA